MSLENKFDDIKKGDFVSVKMKLTWLRKQVRILSGYILFKDEHGIMLSNIPTMGAFERNVNQWYKGEKRKLIFLDKIEDYKIEQKYQETSTRNFMRS